MLHLSFVGGDLVCANHGSHQAASVEENVTGMLDHDAMHHGGGTSESSDCPTPSVPHCCDALAACGPALALGSVGPGSLTVIAPADLPHASASHLTSRARGPEPPPPKA
jgi:hypothetical protein